MTIHGLPEMVTVSMLRCIGGLGVVLILALTSTYSANGRNNKRVAVLYIDTLFPR